MNETEALLTYAAKALRLIKSKYDEELGLNVISREDCPVYVDKWWNPVLDSGQALDLMAVCGLSIRYGASSLGIRFAAAYLGDSAMSNAHEFGRYRQPVESAVRQAIVEGAAKMMGYNHGNH